MKSSIPKIKIPLKSEAPTDQRLAFSQFFQMLDKFRESVKGADPAELDAAIAEAVAAAKRATARDMKRR